MRRRLQRLLSTRPRKIIAVAVVVVLVAAIALVVWPDSEPEPVASRDVQVTVPGGPGVAEPVTLDATLYLPEQIPAPAILMAHGFGGSKRSLAADAAQSARDGFVVLAYSARGFGRSTGQIALDSLDYEIPDARALVDWLATQPEVQLDGPGDPRMGVTGGSYGGALSLMLAGTDPRVDALVPLITWNDLSQALFPNAQATPDDLVAPTPAAAEGVADGVFKKFWASTLIASVTTGASLSASPTGIAQGDSGDSGFIRRGGSGTQTSAAPTPAPETRRCRRYDARGGGRRRRRGLRGELRSDSASRSAPPTPRPRRPAASPPSCRHCSTGPAPRRWSATSPRRPCSCRASGTPCSASSRPTRTPAPSPRTVPSSP